MTRPSRSVARGQSDEQLGVAARILLSPVTLYLLLGMSLLYLVYCLEQLAMRVDERSELTGVHFFTPTRWHEERLWITAGFPITAPVLAIRGLLILLYFLLRLAFHYLNELADRLWSVVQRVSRWIANTFRMAWTMIAEIVETILAQLAIAWKWLLATTVSIVKRTVEVLRAIWVRLTMPLKALWKSLIQILNSLVNAIVHAGRRLLALLGTIWRWITAPVKALWRMVAALWSRLVSALGIVVNAIREAGRRALALLGTIWRWITAPVKALWRMVAALWNRLVSALGIVVNAIREAGRRALALLGTLWRWITAPIKALWRMVAALWSRLVSALGIVVNAIREAGRRALALLGTFWRWVTSPLKALWRMLVAFLSALGERLASAFRFVWANFASWVDGLGRFLGSIVEAIRPSLDQAITLIKQAFVEISRTVYATRDWITRSVRQNVQTIRERFTG